MRAVVVYVVCALLAILDAPYAASDACLSLVVFAQVLRVWQHGLEELQRHYFHLYVFCRVVGQRCLIHYLIDAAHAYILYHVEMFDVLLTESHPESRFLYCGIVFHEALQLLMVQQIAFARPNVGVCQRLVYLQRFGLYPLAVFVVEAFLRYLAYVYFRVEVCGERLVVVACVAVHDVERVHLVEVVFCGIRRINAAHSRVESAS